MEVIGNVISGAKELYDSTNKANLSGAIDVVVVKQPDGAYTCSPFHVRFGKLSVWSPAEKVVKIEVNGEVVPIQMKLGSSGEAFFVKESEEEQAVPEDLATSPLPQRSERISPQRPAGVQKTPKTPEPQGKPSEDGGATTTTLSAGGAVDAGADVGEDADAEGDKQVDELATPTRAKIKKKKSLEQWDWGALPQRQRGGKSRSSSSSTGDGAGGFEDAGASSSGGAGAGGAGAASEGGADGESRRQSWMTRITSMFSAEDDGSRIQQVPGGVYLRDLDPEQAAGLLQQARIDVSEQASTGGGGPGDASGPGAGSSPHVVMSLCGLHNLKEFRQHRVTWAKFKERPSLMSDPDLVIWIDGRVYTWSVAGPIVMALAVFGQPLDSEDINELVQKHVADKDAEDAEIFHEKEGSGSWWFFGQPSPSPTQSRPRSRVNSGSSMDLPSSAVVAALNDGAGSDGAGSVASGDEGMSSDGGGSTLAQKMSAYSKALTLDSDGIRELNLQPGENKATFTVTSKMQGVATVQCHIFLWSYDDKVVISDVDGTITRSDLLGHAANLVGRDWTHDGVASLYTSIQKNGYKMMYLTSRSISHAPLTREYIVGLKQDGGVQLPRGPILFSPQNFFMSIHREVIARNPQEFKVACLSSIVNLFPTREQGPFAAGFGNRHTDEISYRAVRIADDRIFTIDPKGNVKIGAGETSSKVVKATAAAAGGSAASVASSYPQLQKFCDLYFPPVVNDDASAKPIVEARDFSAVNYWGSGSFVPEGFDIDAALAN